MSKMLNTLRLHTHEVLLYRRTAQSSAAAGFTIVELLIVIVIIGILAALVIITYNGLQTRANNAKQDADVSQYLKAIMLARENTGKVLKDITGSSWSAGNCTSAANNPSATEPRDLPKTHTCWVRYYSNLSTIGAAAGINLSSLQGGDARGNPYVLDENENEQVASPCNQDRIYKFSGSGISFRASVSVPNSLAGC